MSLEFRDIFANEPIIPAKEMAAYEALWENDKASFKSLAELFQNNPGILPSQIVDNEDIINDAYQRVISYFDKANVNDFHFAFKGTIDFPAKLDDAKNPLQFYYYRGNPDLVFSKKSVAVVGTRSPSEEGIRRTRQLVRDLVKHDFTIFSGLASGIDKIAHESALEFEGRTVAVLGTPLTEYYPKENKELQDIIAQDHLLISQVPVLKYKKQTYKINRFFFPERNATMSALSDATIIVEAGETSGTLTQAKHALYQGRKLFILNNCFENPAISWPAKFEREGAIRVRTFEDILKGLEGLSNE
ncbi:DNA-processing protein DprA [Pelistega ratti]|uniref:DNA-processing protein DprA n=1 Tax=Pelistega ratti TaxID=2652177 RepID=UPI00135A8BB2|nr:DNA-processing protein DprA [Pelistega ratti]